MTLAISADLTGLRRSHHPAAKDFLVISNRLAPLPWYALPWLMLTVLPMALQAEDKAAEKTKEYVDADGSKH